MSQLRVWFAGIVVGAALAAMGIWFGSQTGEPVAETVTTTTTTLVTEGPWIPEGGVRYQSTIVVPTDLSVDEGIARLDYSLYSLGESAGIFFGGLVFPPALPDHWVLATNDGSTYESATDFPRPSAVDDRGVISDTVRFEVPPDFDEAAIATISVRTWRVPTPVEVEFDMTGGRGSATRLFDGTAVSLQTILEQTTGAIVDFDVDRPSDPWRGGALFTGVGAGWRSSRNTFTGTGLAGDTTGFQLRWETSNPPQTITIRYSTTVWSPLPGELAIHRGPGNA